MALKNAFEDLNEQLSQRDVALTLKDILVELKLLNASFEEAFRTQFKREDIGHED